jgi:hypothetical protein
MITQWEMRNKMTSKNIIVAFFSGADIPLKMRRQVVVGGVHVGFYDTDELSLMELLDEGPSVQGEYLGEAQSEEELNMIVCEMFS